MQGRNRERLPHAQRPQCGSFEFQRRAVDLVGNEQHRNLRSAQHLDCLGVGIRRTHGGVNNEHDHVGVDRCPARLLADL